jgi:hypothetical protein
VQNGKQMVNDKSTPIRLACLAFSISVTCYRYQGKLSKTNEEIADWLIRLTQNQCNWGFGLCFLYLRNVKGFKWNHKRAYRIYRELKNVLSLEYGWLEKNRSPLQCQNKSIKSGLWIYA